MHSPSSCADVGIHDNVLYGMYTYVAYALFLLCETDLPAFVRRRLVGRIRSVAIPRVGVGIPPRVAVIAVRRPRECVASRKCRADGRRVGAIKTAGRLRWACG